MRRNVKSPHAVKNNSAKIIMMVFGEQHEPARSDFVFCS